MSQFPYPRKSSDPSVAYPGSPYATPSYTSARATSYSARDRKSLKSLAPLIGGGIAIILFLLWFLRGDGSGQSTYKPPGTPDVIIVTTIDPQMSESYRVNLMDNRKDYARRHGYGTFFPNVTDYDLMHNQPATWATVPAIRHAMASHPHTPWFWYLSPTALIMNFQDSLESKVLDHQKLDSLMLRDRPVVPPDSIIRTYSHLQGKNVDLIISQDHDGLAGGSLLLRSGDFAKFFLDVWFDPLYRSYNFQKAEGHALEHIVQWHGTILAKLGLVPQKILNSYTSVHGPTEAIYTEGDFIANFHGCARDPARNCEQEMSPLLSRWRELRDQSWR